MVRMKGVINRDRRKLLATIFADTAKYTLTAGVIGTFVGGRISQEMMIILASITAFFCFLAYFVMPQNQGE